MNQQNYS